jgi:uncharacterized protein YbjT (DUF2867 family)
MTTLLVTGATGTFGSAVAEILHQAGHTVRVLVRNRSRLKVDNYEVFTGDFSDIPALEAAAKGVSGIFLASFDRPEMPDLQRNVLKVAKNLGIQRIARISSMGVDNPRFGSMMDEHARGERILEDSGLGFTHLRPSWVLQNFLPTSAATPVRNCEIRLPASDGRVGFVDARDVAAVAATSLTEPGHEGKIYELTGPDACTHAELADALSSQTGLPITYENISPEQYVSELRSLGWPTTSIESMSALFDEMRRGGDAIVTDHVTRVTNRAPLTIHDFARDYASAFIQA